MAARCAALARRDSRLTPTSEGFDNLAGDNAGVGTTPGASPWDFGERVARGESRFSLLAGSLAGELACGTVSSREATLGSAFGGDGFREAK